MDLSTILVIVLGGLIIVSSLGAVIRNVRERKAKK